MPQSDEIRTALIIDDDDVFRDRLRRALVQRRWGVEAVPSGDEAIRVARERTPDLALVDLRMPGKPGLDVVEELRALDASMTIIVLTGYGSIPTAISAVKRGADHYISKPADADQILAVYESLQSSPGGESETPDIPASVPSLGRVEWEHVQRVMADCGGNISQAARLLRIHRRSLQRKLSKYPPSH